MLAKFILVCVFSITPTNPVGITKTAALTAHQAARYSALQASETVVSEESSTENASDYIFHACDSTFLGHADMAWVVTQ